VTIVLAVANFSHCGNGHDLALLPQSSTVKPEHDRDRNHYSREAAEQSPCPLDAQVGEHLASEEREASRDDRSKHDIGSYSGSGTVNHMVSVLSFLVVNSRVQG
jgi:hypothetical protein